MTKRFRNHLVGFFGLVIVIAVVFMALFAPFLAPHDPVLTNLPQKNVPPVWHEGGSWQYPLGTDQLGRDLLSRIIWGSRVSILVGVSTTAIQMVVGVTVGVLAGYYGGLADRLLMRFADLWMTIPFLILAMSVMAATGPGLLNTILVLGFAGWVTYARVVRSEVLSVREHEYVVAARSVGTSVGRIVFSHILPNVIASIIVIGTLQISRMIIAEAALSFLGLGIQPPQPAWGSMIAAGRDYLFRQWWIATMPGLALLLVTLGLNLFGDSLRDLLDPTLQGHL